MLINDCNHIIDGWIAALDQYKNPVRLRAQPVPKSWSIGQLYQHLIADTRYFIKQMQVCTQSDNNRLEEASPAAKKMLLNNDFPDLQIAGSPRNAFIRQPGSTAALQQELEMIKTEIDAVYRQIMESKCQGKAAHPALGYFNALEWLQFTEMHFRHHLRQKKRINAFLQASGL
jgi:hypothetical protein